MLKNSVFRSVMNRNRFKTFWVSLKKHELIQKFKNLDL